MLYTWNGTQIHYSSATTTSCLSSPSPPYYHQLFSMVLKEDGDYWRPYCHY